VASGGGACPPLVQPASFSQGDEVHDGGGIVRGLNQHAPRRDYHPSQVVELYNHIAEGLFKTYAESTPTTRNPVTLVP
jgi:hypothetical protein